MWKTKDKLMRVKGRMTRQQPTENNGVLNYEVQPYNVSWRVDVRDKGCGVSN